MATHHRTVSELVEAFGGRDQGPDALPVAGRPVDLDAVDAFIAWLEHPHVSIGGLSGKFAPAFLHALRAEVIGLREDVAKAPGEAAEEIAELRAELASLKGPEMEGKQRGAILIAATDLITGSKDVPGGRLVPPELFERLRRATATPKTR